MNTLDNLLKAPMNLSISINIPKLVLERKICLWSEDGWFFTIKI